MTEEIRPICLYIETCLHKKEGTRDCNKCEHHLNYWTEVMIRDMEKNIDRLKQENEKLNTTIYSLQGKITTMCEHNKELWQKNEELSNLIRNTEDYTEVCSICKDEVTIYPNISGRTEYTQNEVECITLQQIIARKNNLKQENEELKEKIKDKPLQCLLYNDKQNKCALFTKTVAYHCALEEIREMLGYGYIVDKINEVLS